MNNNTVLYTCYIVDNIVYYVVQRLLYCVLYSTLYSARACCGGARLLHWPLARLIPLLALLPLLALATLANHRRYLARPRRAAVRVQ